MENFLVKHHFYTVMHTTQKPVRFEDRHRFYHYEGYCEVTNYAKYMALTY